MAGVGLAIVKIQKPSNSSHFFVLTVFRMVKNTLGSWDGTETRL